MNLLTASKTNAVTIITPDAPLPDTVKAALHQSLAAFATSGQIAAEDRAANRMAYKIAMKGFHPILVTTALNHLMLHNPRNPFPFTAQDLYEALKSWQGKWRSAVRSYFLEHNADWSYTVGGPVPFEPGCKVPDIMVEEAMRLALQTAPGSHWHHVTRMPDTRFAKLRKEWFQAQPDPGNSESPPTDYTHAAAVAERAKIKADREFDTYLASLDPELRRHRSYALHISKAQGEKLTEEELIAKARERMEEEDRLTRPGKLTGSDMGV